MQMRWRWVARRAAMAALLILALTSLGCGAKSGGATSLSPAASRTATMDGFVFVPSRARSRQTATGSVSIPFAIIRVYLMPYTTGQAPLRQTQAGFDATTGRYDYYRLDNLPLHVPLLLTATDPFDPKRVLQAVISFESLEQIKRRDVTPVSTVAAAVAQQNNLDKPLTDAQVQALELVADEVLGQQLDTVDVTIDPEALAAVANTAAAESFGTVVVRVFSNPVAVATIYLNEDDVGMVTTALPPARQSGAANELTIANVPIGVVVVEAMAPGFQDALKQANVLAGKTTMVDIVLRTEPTAEANQPPTIVSAQASPALVPFQGGTVTVAATIRDPDSPVLVAVADVTRAVDNPPGAVEEVTTLTLSRSGDSFTGSFEVPGNSKTTPASYQVELVVVDDYGNEAYQVLSFQVLGVQGPPTTPTDTGPRRLVGNWTEQRSGSTYTGMVAPTAAPKTMTIGADASFIITSPLGSFSGQVQFPGTTVPTNLGPGLTVDPAYAYVTILLVTASDGGALPAVGTSVPSVAIISADLQTLLIINGASTTPQLFTEWKRSGPAARRRR